MNEIEIIQSKIYELRGQRVMLDRDLAEFYQVTTGNLNKAVKRNIKHFPPDFMFQLTKDEFEKLKNDLIFQNGISNWGGLVATVESQCRHRTVAQGFEALKLEIEEILHDQNDINELTGAQLDAISTALAELQSDKSRLTAKPRRPIGFNV
ncbi:MAG: ORF6N domain-containing protein [Prevotella sp.]|nr:ORF6N domain-containing protein [Prevotella sp.]